jgi:hypothetical protein
MGGFMGSDIYDTPPNKAAHFVVTGKILPLRSC